MKRGTVKWWNDNKGYGFLSDESGGEFFAHFSAIEGSGFLTLAEGENVEFEAADGPRGPQATVIKKGGTK